MARTILEIAQEAAERHATAPAPTKLFDTNTKIARVLRHAAKDTMRDIMRKGGWMGVSELHSVWTFTLVKGRFAYPLPPDWLRAIPRTEQRNGWEMGLIGPADPVTWSRWLSGAASVAAPMGWRIKNNMIIIEPTPQATELVHIEYISRYPVVSELRDGDYNFSSRPITVSAPYVPRDGHLAIQSVDDVVAPEPDDATYGGDLGYDEGTYGTEVWEALTRINPLSSIDPKPMVRRPEFTADTDLPAFDDDYLLSLGMTFRLRRGLGLEYVEAADEYEEELEVKRSTDAGGAREFTIGGDRRQHETVPLGDGKWMLS